MTKFHRVALVLLLGSTQLVALACNAVDDLRGSNTPVARPTEPARPSVPVRRGQISETVRGVGRVTSVNEMNLFFRAAGRIRTLNVEAGQPIKKGDVIAELEIGQLGVQVEIARTNLQIAELRSAQAAEMSGDSTIRIAAANLARAQAEHARAIAELEGRQAVTGADAGTWDAAAASARARLQAVNAGAPPAEVATADQVVTTAAAAITRAEAELAKAEAGYTPEQVSAAEHAVEAARNTVYAAQIERDAARGRGDGAGTAAGDARISTAQAGLDAASSRLATMRQGGRPEDVEVARKALESARAIHTAAVARLNAVKAGPSAADVAVARSAVAEAQARAEAARSSAAGLPSSVQAARAAVDAAAASVEVAKATYEQRVHEVKAAGGKAVEAAVAEKQLDIARLNLKALEQQVEDARLRAPIDGVIGQLLVKAGEQVQAYGVVGAVADPAKLRITVDVPAADLAKVALGQEARISIEAAGGKLLTEKVVEVPPPSTVALPASAGGEARPVRISLAPGLPGLSLGVAANVAIVTQQKENALIVPAAAVKRFGGRKLVQVVGADGRRRDVEVETGITTDTDVEILDGLSEGQTVAAS